MSDNKEEGYGWGLLIIIIVTVLLWCCDSVSDLQREAEKANDHLNRIEQLLKEK